MVTPAFAADLYEPPVTPRPAPTWTGFHIGGGGGYGSAVYDERIDFNCFGCTSSENQENAPLFQGLGVDVLNIFLGSELGAEGGFGTIEGGYDFQFGDHFVLGILGSYDWSDIKYDAKLGAGVCFEPSCGPNAEDSVIEGELGLGYTLTAKNTWSILGRFGYLLNPDVLAYIVAGYSETEMEGQLSGLLTGTDYIGYNYDFTLKGLTLGGGLEAKLSPNIRAKLEYRYIDYDTLTESIGIPNFGEGDGDPRDSLALTTKASQQTVRAVVSYQFNPFGGADGMYATPTADYVEPEQTVASWTGLYIGGGGGYGSATYDERIELFCFECSDGDGPLAQFGPIDILSIFAENDFGGKGPLGTIEGGFDFQIGENFVVGVLASYDWTDIKSSSEIGIGVCFEPSCGPTSAESVIEGELGIGYTLTAEDTWSILGRFGYLVTPDVLAYGLVGYSETSMNGRLSGIDSADVTGGWDGYELASYDFTLKGLTLGGGLEAKVTENIHAKVEYRYIDYDTLTNFVPIGAGERDGIEFTTNASQQTVRGVVSYHFNPFAM